MLVRCSLTIILVLLAGCAHYPINEPAGSFDADAGYRFEALEKSADNSDELFVCLTFSGGGTRAAALAYGVLQELRHTELVIEGEPRRLIDEIDCISSVSGGAFTAAYYGLYRERLFEDFEAQFLNHNVQGALTRQLFNPVNLMRLASPYYGRIDLSAEYYDREIFAGATFADLQRAGRPYVILNATNLGPGRRFAFTQTHFDALGSDLQDFPVARAVAASSAFPLLLSPVSLVNHSTVPDYETPWWHKEAQTGDQRHLRRYEAARNLDFYLDETHSHVHLMDGGLSDNTGSQAILHAFDRGFIRKGIVNGDIRRLAIIVVNARTEHDDDISRKARPPGIFTVLGKTGTVAMDNYTFESVQTLRDNLQAHVQAARSHRQCGELLAERCPSADPLFPFDTVDPYVIEVNFQDADRIPGENADDYLNLPTSFKLSRDQVRRLIEIGPKLLHASEQYQCLLAVLKAESEGDPRPDDCPLGAGVKGPDGG